MIDFSQTICDFSGKVVKDGVGEGAEDLTLKKLCLTALLAPDDAKSVSGEDKMKRFRLAQVLFEACAPLPLKAEEIVLLKYVIGKCFSPLLVGRAYALLDKT